MSNLEKTTTTYKPFAELVTDNVNLAKRFASYYRMTTRKRIRQAAREAERRQLARIDDWLQGLDPETCAVAQLGELQIALNNDPIEVAEHKRLRRKRKIQRVVDLMM